MEGIYPLILDGEQAGEVTVSAQGAWTVVSVRCAMRPGIVRVSVYGAGREGYLGVLTPEGDALTLHRRLSRNALRDFPEPVEYAGAAGAPAVKESVGRDDPGAPPAEEPADCDDPGAPPVEEAPPAEEAPTKDEAPPDVEALSWYASPDGALVCFDGTENLLALPLGDMRIPAQGGSQRTVEGRDYMVFRTQNGKIVT